MESEGLKLEKDSTTRQACASCKHQRKKCREGCMLAPFFPTEKTKEFQAVHKVFGLSNVQKMIRSLDTEEKRSKAVESLIWEATYREHDPVNGCWEDYKKLQAEVSMLKQIVSKCTGHANSNFEQSPLVLKSSSNYSNLSGMGRLDMGVNHMINCRQANSNMLLSEQNRYAPYMQGNVQGNEVVVPQDYSFSDQLNTCMRMNGELMNQFNQIDIKPLNQFIDANPNAVDIDSLCNENWAQTS